MKPPLRKYVDIRAVLQQYISQTPPTVEKAIVNGGEIVYGTVYEELKSFFDRLGDHLSTSRNGVLDVNDDLEPCFMPLAEQLLFRNFDPGVESARIRRAQAALSFTVVCDRARIAVPDPQRRLIDDWMVKERSGPVQTLLRQVLSKCELAIT